MNSRGTFFVSAGLALGLALVTGCLNLRPRPDPTRHFLLAQIPATNAQPAASPAPRAIGLPMVSLPDYLSPTAFAIRQSETEIRYNDFAQWAERLDKCLTRVLGANLALLLPGDRITLGPWAREGTPVQLEVKFERFEVDAAGLATLNATWRAARPGQSQPLREGRARLEHAGPAPGRDMSGAVESLSAVLGDFSRELAHALRDLP